jgi:hypothetical protein
MEYVGCGCEWCVSDVCVWVVCGLWCVSVFPAGVPNGEAGWVGGVGEQGRFPL